MLHFSQNHTYLPDRFKSNFLCFIVGNCPFPRDQKAAHCHTMQCWHSGVSIIAIERILWRWDDLKGLTMSKYTMQSTVSSQPPRQICTHFRLFCSPPARESRLSGYIVKTVPIGADRWCSNYIWVTNKFMAYKCGSYIRDLTVDAVWDLTQHHECWSFCLEKKIWKKIIADPDYNWKKITS